MDKANTKQRSLGKLISHISRDIHKIVQLEFKEAKIGRGQLHLLHLIDLNPGITQIELSRKMQIDKATVTKGLVKLEKSGLITRTVSSEDQRSRRLHLTSAGESLIPRIISTLEKISIISMAELEASEVTELFRLLDKVEFSIVRYLETHKESAQAGNS